MDELQEALQPGVSLLPTGVPHGLDEAPRGIRSGRQTGQVSQRVGHEAPTLMVAKGFDPPQVIGLEAQVPLTVLSNRCRRPTLPIPPDELSGVPVQPVVTSTTWRPVKVSCSQLTTRRTFPKPGMRTIRGCPKS